MKNRVADHRFKDVSKNVAKDRKDLSKFPRISKVKSRKLTVLVISVILLCAVCLTLGVLFSLQATKGFTNSTVVDIVLLQEEHGSINSTICISGMCVRLSDWMLANVNSSVDPCADFYSYACNRWDDHMKKRNVEPVDGQTTISTYMTSLVEERLKILLEGDVNTLSANSYRRKLKDIFDACRDEFSKTDRNGDPLIKIISSVVGDWYVTGTGHSTPNSFQTALEILSADFKASAFFAVDVKVDIENTRLYVIELYRTGVGMWQNYYLGDGYDKIRNDYIKFMTNVANLLIRDSGITLSDSMKKSRVDTFTSDVMQVETALAQAIVDSRPNSNPYSSEQRVAIGDLNDRINNEIDFVAYFKYMFDEAGVDENTKIVLQEKDYLEKLGGALGGLGDNKQRKLNNYLVWRLLGNYVQDLSWEYIHANREFYVDQTGNAEFLGTWRYCYNFVSGSMNEALGALFIKDHFADQNKAKAEEVVKYTKNELLKNMATTPWFDDQTKQLAIAKMNAMKDKMGYPEYMTEESKVDEIYQFLKVNRSDFFQSMLNMNLYWKKEWNDLLKNGVSWEDWRFNTYDVIGQLHRVWNELIIPAGFLQFPLYDHLLPAYHNFAVMGGMAGHLIVHDIGEGGAWYDIKGKYGNWWSDATKKSYAKAKNCTSTYYSGLTMGPYVNPNTGSPETIPVKGSRYAYDGIAIASGLKIAYQAYKQWVKDNGQEKTAPGFKLNNDQMFFLSFAQSKCYNRNPTALYNNAKQQKLPEDLVTNSILAQSDDFVKAFKCKVGDKMNAKEKCPLY